MKFPVPQPYAITTKFSASHPGIDIAPIPAGTTGRKAVAPEKCKVVQSGYNPSLEGQYLILKGRTKFYYFGHFAQRKVSVNQTVAEGATIGILGMTGKADGIHTHHEVRTSQHEGSIDPEKYYKAAEGEDMFQGKTAEYWYKRFKKVETLAETRGKQVAALKKDLAVCQASGPESNDEEIKDGLFDKIRAIFGK